MRKVRRMQIELGEVQIENIIENIEIDPESRDDLPTLLPDFSISTKTGRSGPCVCAP